MAPVIVLSPTPGLSPYGSALLEKPSNLLLVPPHKNYFRRSTNSLPDTLNTAMKLNTEESAILLKDISNKPSSITETKCVKSKTNMSQPTARQRPFTWSRYKNVSPTPSSASSRRTQIDKLPNSFEEILSTTHRTEREVKASLSKLRRMILLEGLPEENLPKLAPSVQNLIRPTSMRSSVWKHLLGVYHVSANEYIRLIQKGKSCVYDKVRNDTFRTLATDKKFLERVNEDMLIRVLNAFVWKMKPSTICGNQKVTYVQGMNVLAAPFLFTMSEIDAFFSFATFIQTCCPLYVTPTLQGVHCGLKLLDKCLQIIDSKLFNHLKSKNLTAEIYAFPSVLTLCACTPPLEQVLKLWDFLLAYGVHLNILCVIAQLILMRDQLLEAPSPMKLLRTMPELNAKPIINLTVQLAQQIPDELYDQLVKHPFDPSVAASLSNEL
ncbi:5302_t:CDS:2 [Cetraspora pellucida]|uniref:5302_t:CDS:1 n=1 Tax=Cetraspora pellucida TaxID=1433469 RepID=A0A9N9CZ31_9GLOM|nr:5302_t:CDS:2 [Cetraspora pellucida]